MVASLQSAVTRMVTEQPPSVHIIWSLGNESGGGGKTTKRCTTG
ncbi:hypothetical protein [Klebsiella quasipneumoniae]